MANEEVLGPRKTMFVLVIVVGCFAVLWPRIISPLILGHSRDQLKPNQFDRDAGCCEVIFETEMAVLELINEVCYSAAHTEGKLSPYAAAECRKAVNETCGLDIAAFLKRSDNVGKTSKMLLKTMKESNSSCLKEHFGVPVWSLSKHQPLNPWTWQDTLKQERPIRGAGPHPALRERGRAIPAGTPAAPRPVVMPPHVRVRSSPLAGYFEIDVKPPPIPGMRPPLGSPGGPAPTPKSSMGFVMPIYTICIIVFFVYTLSKILFKRTGTTPYETVSPDPQFRRRVFRDDSRTSPDKLGPKERDTIVTAISGLVAEVQQQMEASYAQNQQRQDVQENNSRPYTNGTILHNSGPVHIVASEYKGTSKENSPEIKKDKELSPEPIELAPKPDESSPEPQKTISEQVQEESIPETKEILTPKESTPEPEESSPELIELEEPIPESIEKSLEPEEHTPELKDPTPVPKDLSPEPHIKIAKNNEELDLQEEALETEELTVNVASEELSADSEDTTQPEKPKEAGSDEENITEAINDIEIKADILLEALKDESNDPNEMTENLGVKSNGDALTQSTKEFLIEEAMALEKEEKKSTPELLEEAIKDEDQEVQEEQDDLDEHENTSVKVMGMELTAHATDGGAWAAQAQPQPPRPQPTPTPTRPHEAEEVQSIFLETAIPQQARVLVARCHPPADAPHAHERPHEPMVVSGKMTLSLIQDAPRDTPERDPESTVDDFTTASAITQPAEKDDESDEEIEEEIEVEEIEEEVEVEEDEEDEEEPLKAVVDHKKVEKGPE